jgi:hypothetical protein
MELSTFQRKKQNGPKLHVTFILSHQKNANQSYIETNPHSIQVITKTNRASVAHACNPSYFGG